MGVFFFQAEDGIRDGTVTGVQTCALPIWVAAHTDRFRCIVNHAGVYDTLSHWACDVTQGRHKAFGGQIGRASCRERVWTWVVGRPVYEKPRKGRWSHFARSAYTTSDRQWP